MKHTLRRYLLSMGVFVMLLAFGFTTAYSQSSNLLGPYTPDTNTVVLMHFDGNLKVESGSNISSPDTAIAYETDGVSTSEASAMSSLGTSLNLTNPPSEVNQDADSYDFVAIPHYKDLNYPDDIYKPTDLSGHHEAQSIRGNMTIDMWLKVDAYHKEAMQALVKPGDGVSETNEWQFDNYEARVRPTESGLGFLDGGWHPADGAPKANPCCDGTIFKNTVETAPFLKENQWVKYTLIKDTSINKAVLMAHDVNGNLLARSITAFPESADTSDTRVHNDIFIGWQPVWNIGGNYPPPREGKKFGETSGLGGLGTREFNGNIDELRLSNTVRDYGVKLVQLKSDSAGQFFKPSVISAEQDSITFGVNLYKYNVGSGFSPTVTLHYNTGSGYQTATMTHEAGRHYEVTLPMFEGGSVNYYVRATNSVRNVTLPENASDGVNNESFVVEFPNQMVYNLTFENGSGVPTERSSFGYPVEVLGDTTYDGEAPQGTFSFRIGPNSHLRTTGAEATFSEVVTVELWFKLEEKPHEWSRLIARQASSTDSSVVNYSMFFKNGELWARGTGVGDVESGMKPKVGKWYRAVYMISPTAHSIQLWDINGNLVANDVEKINGKPPAAPGPLFVGQGNFFADSAVTALVDNVQIDNHLTVQGPFIAENPTNYVNAADTADQYPVSLDIAHAGAGVVDAKIHYKDKFGWKSLNLDRKSKETGVYEKFIPSQEGNTVVPYYFTVNEGNYSATLPTNATQADTTPNFHLAVYEPYTKVLDLDFEEFKTDSTTNMRVPVDQSAYSVHNDVSLHGNGPLQMPNFSKDAPQGNRSVHVERSDSSLVRIDSRFTTTPSMTITAYFKMREMDPNASGFRSHTRFITHNSTIEQQWWAFGSDWGATQPAWQFMIHKSQHFRGLSNNTEGGLNGGSVALDSYTIKPGKWYKGVYVFHANDTSYAQLYDVKADTLLAENGAPEGGHILDSRQPVTIGTSWIPELGSWKNTPHHFSGYVDDLEVYNYAAPEEPPKVTSVTDVDSAKAGGDPVTIEANVMRNGFENVYLIHRKITAAGATTWDSTKMKADFTGTYSAKIPTQDPGTVVEYWVGTQNDFGLKAASERNRVAFTGNTNAMSLYLDFESGKGAIVDSSQFEWTVMKKGQGGKPTFTQNAIGGNYALEFNAKDSTYLQINAPYPFLNQQSFTLDIWFKSYTENNTGVHLVSKENAVDSLWNRMNFRILGIGGNTWSFGGFVQDTALSMSERFITNTVDDKDRFGAQSVKDALKDSTWYHAHYIQNVKTDSIRIAINASDGTVIAQTAMSIPGDTKKGPILTRGPFRIGHAGPTNTGGYFHGVIDEVRILNYARGITDIPSGTQRDLPEKFSLGNNYPNPFNPTTTIEYALPQNTDVTLKVYNLLGREVATLVNGKKQAGRHQVKFDAGNLASGVYFYRIHTPEFTKVRKMMLIK